jgi:hypothetical protein
LDIEALSQISNLKSQIFSMEFTEFFKKKRIDLAALKNAEPALFSEFETHYAQMGEKSFDHSKKYWFNKLRRQFQLAPEVKTEKAHIANPLAEQTITESLIETSVPAAPSAKLGFAPKFRAGNMPKPAPTINEDKKQETPAPAPTENNTGDRPAESKPAYQPRFKMTPKTDAEEIPSQIVEENPVSEAPKEAKATYQPRFKMKPKEGVEELSRETSEENTLSEAPKEAKSTYQPRFKMKPKAEGITLETPEVKPETEETKPGPEETPVAKPAYKPRFNIKNLPPKA